MLSLHAPCTPHWLLVERGVPVQIVDQLMNCVGFVGVPTERGFSADGTCFFVQWTEEHEGFIYMVTAKHLIRPFEDREQTIRSSKKIWIRVNRKNAAPRVISTIRGDWVCHPNRSVDACIHPFDFRRENEDDLLDISTLGLPEMALNPLSKKFFVLNLGDDVFMPSVFVGRLGEKSNIPVVR